MIGHMDIAGFDLNLMKAFDALYAERHVTRAGSRIGLSQSAMSGALTRLRELLGDELFVRTPSDMQPTPRAHDLAGPVSDALHTDRGGHGEFGRADSLGLALQGSAFGVLLRGQEHNQLALALIGNRDCDRQCSRPRRSRGHLANGRHALSAAPKEGVRAPAEVVQWGTKLRVT